MPLASSIYLNSVLLEPDIVSGTEQVFKPKMVGWRQNAGMTTVECFVSFVSWTTKKQWYVTVTEWYSSLENPPRGLEICISGVCNMKPAWSFLATLSSLSVASSHLFSHRVPHSPGRSTHCCFKHAKSSQFLEFLHVASFSWKDFHHLHLGKPRCPSQLCHLVPEACLLTMLPTGCTGCQVPLLHSPDFLSLCQSANGEALRLVPPLLQ